MIKEQVQRTLSELSVLRESLTLFGPDEGWSDVDIDWVLSNLEQDIRWLESLHTVLRRETDE